LQRLERLRPWLADRGIELVAMTHAPPAAVAKQIDRDGLTFPILIDSNLALTRLLGWYDKTGLKHVTRRVLGVPIGIPVGFRRMPRPATALIDELGNIRWLDMTDDYRLRGNEDTIRAGVQAAFGADGPN
jgi:peroxiredoxin